MASLAYILDVGGGCGSKCRQCEVRGASGMCELINNTCHSFIVDESYINVPAQDGAMAFTSRKTFHTIPANTLIEACGLNGERLATWHCEASRDLTVASLALVIKLATTLEVLRKAIHLMWDPVEPTEDDGQPAGALMHRANVKVVLKQLQFEEFPEKRCLWCGDQCLNADDFMNSHTCDENCYRCGLPDLCDLRKIQIPRKGPSCFQCLEVEELALLSHSQRRRYDLVRTVWEDSE